MSVLDTFWILFKSNADDVDKANKKATASGKDLQEKLNSSTEASDKLGQAFTDMVESAAAAVAGIVTVGAAVRGFFNAENYALELQRTSAALDTNITDLAAWGDAVTEAGGNAQGLLGDVKNLSNNLSALQKTGGQMFAPMITPLDITLMNNGVEVMDKTTGKAKDMYGILLGIADVMHNRMTRAQAFNFGSSLGLSEGTVMLLQKGSAGVQEIIARQKELGQVTAAQGVAAALLNKNWQDVGKTYRALNLNLGNELLPTLDTVLHWLVDFTGWLGKLPELLRENSAMFKDIGVSIGIVAGVIGLALLPEMIALGAAALVVALPFLAFLGAVELVYFAIQGFIKLIHGAQAVWHAMGEGVAWVEDKFKGLLGWVQKVFAAFEAFSKPGSMAERIARAKAVFETEAKTTVTGGNDTRALYDRDQALMRAQHALGVQGTNPIANAVGGSTIINNVRGGAAPSVSIGKVDVVTQATDATGIANSFGGVLNDVIHRTITSVDNGVHA